MAVAEMLLRTKLQRPVIAMKTHIFVIVMKTGDDCRAALAMTQ